MDFWIFESNETVDQQVSNKKPFFFNSVTKPKDERLTWYM
jgi:hypothetical protein